MSYIAAKEKKSERMNIIEFSLGYSIIQRSLFRRLGIVPRL